MGSEVLADAILTLADQYDEADKLVERLLAPADSAEARIKGELNALKRECQNYAWNAGRALAIRMRMLLSDIASSMHDPQTGVDLMLRFYETDAAVFECCDDSNGDVGDIYRNEAPELFVRYAKVFSNRSELLARIKTLVSADEYGVRDSLLECADAWMTPLEMRLLADDSWLTIARHAQNRSLIATASTVGFVWQRPWLVY